MFNLPTILTLLRIILIPVIGVVYNLPGKHSHFIAALLFALAGATDWLDGYLARKQKVTTQFGAFLDPVADKLLVAVSLILVVSQNYLPYLALPASVIIGREIVISALREWMAGAGKSAMVKVQFVAKVKTGFQMAAIGILLWYHPNFVLSSLILWVGVILLYVAAALTLYTMIIYLKVAWFDLTSSSKTQ